MRSLIQSKFPRTDRLFSRKSVPSCLDAAVLYYSNHRSTAYWDISTAHRSNYDHHPLTSSGDSTLLEVLHLGTFWSTNLSSDQTIHVQPLFVEHGLASPESTSLKRSCGLSPKTAVETGDKTRPASWARRLTGPHAGRPERSMNPPGANCRAIGEPAIGAGKPSGKGACSES